MWNIRNSLIFLSPYIRPIPRQVPPGLDSKEGIPLNKGKLYLSETSPVRVVEAYSTQFHKDFSLFLKSRAEEMLPGGRMALSFTGRRDTDHNFEQSRFQYWELLALALMSLASEGLVEEEKIDSFNFPYYAPCPEEVKFVVQTDGSFLIDRLETFEFYCEDRMKTEFGELSSGQRIAKTFRAVVESMLESHFGREIMDVLFRRYGEIMDDHLSRNRARIVVLVVSLIRMG
ncbi:hypothetical protein C3L33_11406, partial [Rhododendron williamsianum]